MESPNEGAVALARLRDQYDDVLRAVSHDLRTPLFALVLQAQLLERSLDGQDPNKQRATTIIAVAREANAMVEELVEAARLEAGLSRLEAELVTLPTFVRELVERAFPADRSRIQIDADPSLPAVVADPRRLELVVRALLSRSIKAASAIVHLQISRVGMELRLAVRDQLRALPPDALSGLFGRAGGVLHLAKVVAELHGGRVWLEQESQGTTIILALPLIPEMARAEGRAPKAGCGPRSPRTRAGE